MFLWDFYFYFSFSFVSFFFLFWFVSFSFYLISLDACLFSNKRNTGQKGDEMGKGTLPSVCLFLGATEEQRPELKTLYSTVSEVAVARGGGRMYVYKHQPGVERRFLLL